MQQNRLMLIESWLKNIMTAPFELKLLNGDASFRRYFRLQTATERYIVMDAPPDKEPLDDFLAVHQKLSNADVMVPKIHAVDLSQGFLLLDDLGDDVLLTQLTHADPTQVDTYYQQAMTCISAMQRIPSDDLPVFDDVHMMKEMQLFTDWFLDRHCKQAISTEEQNLVLSTMEQLATQLAQLPQVFIHRDFHSRNLMCCDGELAVIDFQDAMHGPMAYDLVSLLKDCYINWPRAKVVAWVNHHYEHSPWREQMSAEAFLQAFDLCGLQRHIKVLGIFSRLYWRDGKDGYLADIPRVMNYVLECSMLYESYKAFGHWFERLNISHD